MRSIASGVTFGYADEIAAKMDELTGRGGSYEQNVAQERRRDKQISPWISVPGEIAGAVAGTIAAAPVRAPIAAATGFQACRRGCASVLAVRLVVRCIGSGNAEEGGRTQRR